MSKSCQGLLRDFVKCLRESDCMKVEHKDVKVCAQEVEECAGLRYSYFSCKRGQMDARNRLRGNKAMPALVEVTVRWRGQALSLTVDLCQPPAALKHQLFQLTGVRPERQKLLGAPGGLLRDDADLSTLAWRPGHKLVMIGSADPVPQPPAQACQLGSEEQEQQEEVDRGCPWQACKAVRQLLEWVLEQEQPTQDMAAQMAARLEEARQRVGAAAVAVREQQQQLCGKLQALARDAAAHELHLSRPGVGQALMEGASHQELLHLATLQQDHWDVQVQLTGVLCKRRDLFAADQAMLETCLEQLASLEGLLRLMKLKEDSPSFKEEEEMEVKAAQLSALKKKTGGTSPARQSSAEAELAPRRGTPRKREDQREQ